MRRRPLLLCLLLFSHTFLHAQDATPPDGGASAAIPAVASDSAGPEGIGSDAYRIGADDVVSISVLHAPELTTTARVTEHGDISLPLLGTVPVAGLTAGELESALEDRLRGKYIREPDVTVQITELQSRAVSVVGAVKRPGIFQLRGTKTLLEVLSLAEGIAEHAGDSVIVFRRTSMQRSGTGADAAAVLNGSTPFSFEVPLKALLASSDPRANVPIYPGDVVNVRAADIVYVVGAIRRPGAFAMRGNERVTVLRALALGEGLLPTAAKGDALVLRTAESGQRVEIAVDLDDVLKGRQQDLALQAQDVLFVPESGGRAVARAALDALTRIVTLRGTVIP